MTKTLSLLPSLYSGSPEQWRMFLDCWRQEAALPPLVGPIAEAQPASKLPPSYRHFVQATGGKGFVVPKSLAEHQQDEYLLFPVSNIGKFANHRRLKASWKAWNDHRTGNSVPDKLYYNYSRDQDPVTFREEYLNDVIAVGDFEGGAVVLLNPKERTADGEFEALYMSTKLPGAYRYRSFAELVQGLYFSEVNPLVSLYDVGPEDIAKTCARFIFKHFRKV